MPPTGLRGQEMFARKISLIQATACESVFHTGVNCSWGLWGHWWEQVEDLKSKLASQETELQLRYQDAEPLIAKIGFQAEKVSQEKAIADAEKQKVLDSNLCKLTASLEEAVAEQVQRQDDVNQTNKTIELTNRLVRRLEILIAVMEGLDPIVTLTDDAAIATWSNKEQPGDRMSTENATILTNCRHWPLTMDLQQRGIKWIKNKYGADLKVIHPGKKGFLKTIERALACRGTVLYMSETVDLVLDLLCGRHTVIKGKYMKTEDKEGEFNKNFCLILHTKLANPHYKLELRAQTTVINFAVIRDGLEDQLLAEVVSAERPDLEKCKSVLAKQQNRFKTELGQLEDDMLSSLSAAQGGFLDNSELVEKLKTTKSASAEIQHKECFAIPQSQAFNAVLHKAIKQAENAGNIQCHISNLKIILLRSKEIELLELDFVFQFGVEHAYKTPVDFLTTQSWSAIKAKNLSSL
ncbi:hypothetical protein AV530_014441 [Patagioenas fasciata monilis]|uniref:Dynein heavy chain ATP-binding dynein motor region domain-containing protein n=1 Tax=Patagioenas fasciata monilis TaxID=372326 RepID=A0A1V4KDH0_PATFA|nr:hypothetical protein AV530_014441 [Patagioenas fasciata monilis]